ncbi:MAG: gamma-glutamylcyclotransferase family protein [Burkholderiaceae bacterium]|nr:gamma-glutamylcyclotransferase family protein [Burkholderiaceae bacterium]
MPEVVPVDMFDASARYVFVYGTLRRGDDNDITRLSPAPRLMGASTVSGVMYHLGAYPGVVLREDGDTLVAGEVYAIEPGLERLLDEIEELYPQQKDEYFKRSVVVKLGAHQLSCLFYEINPAYIRGKPVIASGDWVKERARKPA